jgi:hypothetical protein
MADPATENATLPPRISTDHHEHQCTTSQSRCPWESRGEISKNIQPLSSPHSYPKHPKTALRLIPPTRLNTPHRVSSPALTKPTTECTSHDPISLCERWLHQALRASCTTGPHDASAPPTSHDPNAVVCVREPSERAPNATDQRIQDGPMHHSSQHRAETEVQQPGLPFIGGDMALPRCSSTCVGWTCV